MPCRFSLGMACRPAVRILCGINLMQMKTANNQRLSGGKSSLPENENSMRNKKSFLPAGSLFLRNVVARLIMHEDWWSRFL